VPYVIGCGIQCLTEDFEEPPERVVFVLASNRPQRVLPTISLGANGSTFAEYPRRIGAASAEDRTIEKINVAPEAVQLVARVSGRIAG